MRHQQAVGSAWSIIGTVVLAGLMVIPGNAAGADWREDFADAIYTAWAANTAMPQLNAAHPKATLADGYAVQQAFVQKMLKNDAVGGFKAAVVGEAGQENLGIDGPITGVLPASGIFYAKDKVVINLADTPNRHLETELAYTFRQPIAKPLPDVAALRASIAGIAPVIEAPGGLTEEKAPGSAADIAAWNGNAKAIILGTEHDPEKLDPDAITITLKHKETVVNTAKGADARGGQWRVCSRRSIMSLSGAIRLRPGKSLLTARWQDSQGGRRGV